jgi:hypothetical protein
MRLHGGTPQKTFIFILAAVGTGKLTIDFESAGGLGTEEEARGAVS